ncbi:MAG: FecR domain-containing protein [Syntrophobacteraceae bacterium]
MRKSLWVIFLLVVLVIHGLGSSAAAQGAQDVEILVIRGDTLINICKDYLDDIEEWPEVAAINGLKNPNFILPGQRITIPANLLKGIPAEGKVIFVQGVAEIQDHIGQTWRAARPGDVVREQDVVRTGAESGLEIAFDDGSSFFLRSEATLGLTKVRKRGLTEMIHEMFLEAGRIISHIKKTTGREPRFQIRTPSATAAARGTDFRVGLDSREDTRVEVLKGTVAAKARQRKVLLDEGEGTLIRRGGEPIGARTLLEPPALQAPEPLYRKLPLEFRFSVVDNAVSYVAALTKDPECKMLIREWTVKPTETLKIDGLADGAYFMQVRSVDRLGLEGAPSGSYPIRVRTNPIPPFVQNPVDGQEYKTVTMDFQWLKVPDAAHYHFQLAEDPDFIKLLDDQSSFKGVEFKKKGLQPQPYYFRICSVADDGYVGIWSDTLKFSLLPPPPTPASEPPKTTRKEIHMRWKNVGEGFTYHFQMSRDPEFGEILTDEKVADSQITLKKPKKAGVYYVRVSAVNAEGFEGNFSTPQSFKIKRSIWGYVITGLTVGLILILTVP